jgi:hypothetical protein
MRSPEGLFQNVIDRDTENLRGRHLAAKLVEGVEIGVIEAIKNLTPDTVVDVDEIANHSGLRIDLSAYGHFHKIIMAMTVRIVAFAVHFAVFCLAEIVAVEAMRCGEHISSCEVGLHNIDGFTIVDTTIWKP